MSQTRAADDFATIRARMKELAREAADASAAATDTRSPEPERRQNDRRDGHPPPWAPTIFAKPLAGRR